MKNNQIGFGIVPIILILTIVLGITGAGYVYMQKQRQADTSKISPVQGDKQVPPASTEEAKVADGDAPKYLNVIQEDGSVKQLPVEEVAKTKDQASILRTLHDTCKNPTSSNITLNKVVFDGNSNFKQSGGHAYINASVCTPAIKSLDELGGSGRRIYVRQDNAGTWVIDAQTQMDPKCDWADGKGYPEDIIERCMTADGSFRKPL